ncbi:MAG TPA: sirohydrochlorin chelatase [Bacillota bacterium]
MQAVLFVSHGSRLEIGIKEAVRFTERYRATKDIIREVCFLERAKPSIEEGIATCVARGATKIAVIPILLLTAVHANEDIPLEVQAGKKKYPHITFTYGRPFGVHPKIVEALYDRVVEQHIPIIDDAEVLLVGRGSSDPAVKRDLSKIAQRLEKNYRFKKVNISFLYGVKPRFDDVLIQLQNGNNEQIFIIPYLLFSGILMNDIESKLKQLSSDKFILCESLGTHDNLQEVLHERVEELL